MHSFCQLLSAHHHFAFMGHISRLVRLYLTCVSAAVEEKARVVELNSKLHELCRELRKENALLLDTSKAISAQELSQRKSLTENFQETVEGITKRCAEPHYPLKLSSSSTIMHCANDYLLCRLEEHEKDRLRVVTENGVLKQKLKALCEQYEARDSHYNQQVL